MEKPQNYNTEDLNVSKGDRRIDHGNAAVLLDIGAAHLEGGEVGLKLAQDGHVSWIVGIGCSISLTTPQTVLIPQPSDDPDDPLNWSWFKKHMILVIVALGAFAGDFGSGAGISTIVLQGEEWHMSMHGTQNCSRGSIPVAHAEFLIRPGTRQLRWKPQCGDAWYWRSLLDSFHLLLGPGSCAVLDDPAGSRFHPRMLPYTRLYLFLWTSSLDGFHAYSMSVHRIEFHQGHFLVNIAPPLSMAEVDEVLD